jgi:predicted nucleic acid-binding protein
LKYLLDTCLISELVKPKPDKSVIKWLNGCNEEDLFLSVITIGEIQKGITKVIDKTKKAKLENWLAGDLMERFKNRVLDINQTTAFEWGKLQGESEKSGNKLPAIDSLIAATVLVHNLTLVTRNINDFKNTGISIFNPWEGAF